MIDYPFRDIKVDWKRPPIERDVLRRFTRRSDLRGLVHCLGSLARNEPP